MRLRLGIQFAVALAASACYETELPERRIPSESPFGSCAEAGKLGCHGASQKLRLICDGTSWKELGTCSFEENCDQTSGTCRPILEGCKGKTGGDTYCAGNQVRKCGADLVTDEPRQSCPRLCYQGECTTLDQVAAGFIHTCVLFANGRVRCWSAGGSIPLGDELPIGIQSVVLNGEVELGEPVRQLAAGAAHSCALLDGGRVRCWGTGLFGQLGYGSTENVTPEAAADVDVGAAVVALAAGGAHTCALLENRAVRCWGYGFDGQLGYAEPVNIGDDAGEVPASAGDVNVGGPVVELVAGGRHTCARLETGAVRCWGYGKYGQLGYGSTENVGDDESPAATGNVRLGDVKVAELAAGAKHTCALLDDGRVRCWGQASFGQLGYGNESDIGDDELPEAAGDVDVDPAQQVLRLAAGGEHTCVQLEMGAVRCWGRARYGQLGYGNENDIGDDEVPAAPAVGNVDVGQGETVLQIAAGFAHTCVLFDRGAVRCWGQGEYGALGYPERADIGDDETPASVGYVPLF